MHSDLKSLFLSYAQLDPARTGLLIARAGAKAERHAVGDIARAAAGFAEAFRRKGVGAGDRVVLAHATSLEFVAAFWGCHLVGAVPVPTYPAIPGTRVGMGVARLEGIFRRCRPAALVTLPILAELYREEGVALPPLVTDAVPGAEIDAFADGLPAPSAPALIQFTSGSTSEPKGCVLGHRAVLANTRAVLAAFAEARDAVSRLVSWLPLYHDMGLMAGVLFPFLYAAEGHWKSDEEVVVLQPPEEFIVDPLSWLRLVGEHRAHYTFAPNFALQLVARKLAARPEALDLGELRTVLTGAEPVDPEVVRGFERALAPSGLKSGVVRPAWGLAENTVFGTLSEGGLCTDRVSRALLEEEGLAIPSRQAQGAVEIPSLGPVYPGAELRVVDAAGAPVAERVVGEVELRSDSLMDGYYEDPEATAQVLRPDGWLRTGDLGYLAGGELHLVGRRKDLIIVGGRNVAPQDLERAASGVPGVRAGNVAAFGCAGPGGTERVVVVAEPRGAIDREVVAAEIRRRCRDEAGVVPQIVCWADAGGVPKTSSGKVQRALARERFLAGEFAF